MSAADRRAGAPAATVLISTNPYGIPPLPASLPPGWEAVRRPSDWGLTGWHKRAHYVASAIRLALRSRSYETTVVCHAGIQAVMLGLMRRLGLAGRVVVYDFLTPGSRRLDRLVDFALGGVAQVLVIRSRETETLTGRFSALRGRVRFVPFAVAADGSADAGDDGYLYSAGIAHRDWTTAFAAFATVDARALVAAGGDVPADVPANVSLLGPQSPEQGRALAARARAVVVPFHDTTLPHGPLVILDAMAMGKAVVATDTAGSHDYVTAETGILVPPGDPRALARALQRLVDDPDLARRMGAAGRERALEFSPERLVLELEQALAAAGAEGRPAR